VRVSLVAAPAHGHTTVTPSCVCIGAQRKLQHTPKEFTSNTCFCGLSVRRLNAIQDLSSPHLRSSILFEVDTCRIDECHTGIWRKPCTQTGRCSGGVGFETAGQLRKVRGFSELFCCRASASFSFISNLNFAAPACSTQPMPRAGGTTASPLSAGGTRICVSCLNRLMCLWDGAGISTDRQCTRSLLACGAAPRRRPTAQAFPWWLSTLTRSTRDISPSAGQA